VRYLESRLLAEAAQVNRFTLEQNQAGGSKLPESDREDMEVFLARIRQLLPVLGSDILAPIAQPAAKAQPGGILFCRIKGAEALGQRTANGFVVFHGSTAVLEQRPSAESYPYVVAQRKQLIADGALIEKDGVLVFTKDAEFSGRLDIVLINAALMSAALIGDSTGYLLGRQTGPRISRGATRFLSNRNTLRAPSTSMSGTAARPSSLRGSSP
jgi:hypothetical protein